MAFAAATLTACGGGGGLKKADLAKKANAICAGAKKKASAVQPPSDLKDAKAAAAYFDKIVPITDKETSDLAGLEADDAAKSNWDSFVSAQKSANTLLKTIRDKADSADASGLKDLQKVPAAGKKVATAAAKVGASGCAS